MHVSGVTTKASTCLLCSSVRTILTNGVIKRHMANHCQPETLAKTMSFLYVLLSLLFLLVAYLTVVFASNRRSMNGSSRYEESADLSASRAHTFCRQATDHLLVISDDGFRQAMDHFDSLGKSLPPCPPRREFIRRGDTPEIEALCVSFRKSI